MDNLVNEFGFKSCMAVDKNTSLLTYYYPHPTLRIPVIIEYFELTSTVFGECCVVSSYIVVHLQLNQDSLRFVNCRPYLTFMDYDDLADRLINILEIVQKYRQSLHGMVDVLSKWANAVDDGLNIKYLKARKLPERYFFNTFEDINRAVTARM